MAKLSAPLFSHEARGALAKSLVYFPWKGINAVRKYVVPTNPKSAAQLTQRGYMTLAVAAVHAAEAHATLPLTATDKVAYALWASLAAVANTWFNQVCRNYIDQRVAAKLGTVYSQGTTTPGATQLAVAISIPIGGPTNGDFYYGTSKTAMLSKLTGSLVGSTFSVTITGLTAKTKYYWQFKPTSPASFVGANSGIYTGIPT